MSGVRSEFVLLPLGGTGEIGMNLNAYGYRDRWLVVDMGVMFSRDGVEEQKVLFPDVSFLEARRNRIEGIVLTHAHQDHIGAVRDLWPRLRAPVYCTRFVDEMLREPLGEAGLGGRVPIKVMGETDTVELGPFTVRRVPITHSTVEMSGLIVETPLGRVFHTGDFKLDSDPRVGRGTDTRTLKRLGTEPLLAAVSDSTNADLPGWTPSEGEVADAMDAVLAGQTGRVAVTLFSSNVARVDGWCRAAERAGRSVVLLGRSLERTVRAARNAGYLLDLPDFVPAREYGFLPPEASLLLCTGSQGEPRAALSRIAENKHPLAYLDAGDTVIFSARKIPGCETFVDRVELLLKENGIRVVTAEDAVVHASGHPCAGELRTLYGWLRPQVVVPVHGTPSKLDAHCEVARGEGVEAVRIKNGDVLRLAPGPVEVVRRVRTGRLERVEQPRRRDGRGRRGRR